MTYVPLLGWIAAVTEYRRAYRRYWSLPARTYNCPEFMALTRAYDKTVESFVITAGALLILGLIA